MDGKINYSLGIDNTQLASDAKRSIAEFRGITAGVEREGERMDGVFKKIATAAGLFFTGQQAMQLVEGVVKVRGEFQQLEIAFSTMLRSKEKADALMSKIVDLAAKTPFGLQEVATGAKQLLAYGFAAESVTDEITMLGNVASGVGSQIGDLIYLYGTLKASGRVTQMDINQFAGRGIPIYAELAKVLGVTVDKVRELVGAGEVGFPQIEQAFKNMTEQGGMFYNLMEAQSASLTGQISNLQDSIQQMFNEIGQSKEGVFSDGISGVAYLVENYKEVGKVLTILITTYGAYRAALILTSVAHATAIAGSKAYAIAETAAAVAGSRLTAIQVLQAGATNILSAAQVRLNAVMSLNPYVAIITTVAALAAAMYYFRDSTTASERAQQKLNDTLKGNGDHIDELRSRTQSLIAIINDDTQTKSSQILAYKQLQELHKGRLGDLTLEQFKLQGTTEQQKAYNKELENVSLENLKKQYEDALIAAKSLATITIEMGDGTSSVQDNTISKEYKEAVEYAESLNMHIQDIESSEKLAAMSAGELTSHYRQQLETARQQIIAWEKTNGKIQQNQDGSYVLQNTWNALQINGIIMQWNSLLGLVNKVNSASGGGPTTVAGYEEQINKKKEEQKGASDRASYRKIQVEIDDLEKKKRAITGEVDKKSVAVANKTEKAQERAADIRKRFLEQLLDLEQKQTIAQKFEGEKQIAEVEQRYARMRKEAEKAGFSRIKDAGVFERINKAEKVESGVLKYEQDTKIISDELDKQKQIYQDYEAYKTQVGKEEADRRFRNEYKNFDPAKSFKNILEDERTKIGTATTDAEYQRLLKINEMLAELHKNNFDDENSFYAKAITEYASYEQKKLNIKRGFEQERQKAANNPELQAAISKAEAEQLKQLDETHAETLAKTNKFFYGLVLSSESAVKAQIANIEELLELSGLSPEQRKSLEDALKETRGLIGKTTSDKEFAQLKADLKEVDRQISLIDQHAPGASEKMANLIQERTNIKLQIANKETEKLKDSIRLLSDLAPSVSQLGQSLQELGGDGALGDIGAALAGIGNNLGGVITAFEKIKTTGVNSMDAISAAATFALQSISSIVSAAAARKKAEHDFYINRLEFQYKMNQAVLEELRARNEMSKGWFTTNNIRDMENAMEINKEAFKKYQKSFDDLSRGQAKLGQRNAVDWGKAASSTLSGVAAGAMIGSVVPVVGTVVGAIVGGVVGLFTGIFGNKKKKDTFGGLLQEYPELIKRASDGTKVLNEDLAKQLIAQGLVNDETKVFLQNVIDAKKAYQETLAEIKKIVVDVAGNLGDSLRNSLVQAFKDGTGAAVAFGDSVGKVLEDLVAQMLFNAVFEQQLEGLKKKMIDSFDVTSGSYDANWVDDIIDFYTTAAGSAETFFQTMEEAKKEAEKRGITIFKKNAKDVQEETRKASEKGITAMSQDSATELNGRFTAIQGHTYLLSENVKLLLPYSREAAQNAFEIKGHMQVVRDNTSAALIHLSGIEKNTGRLATIESDMRQVKEGINDINLKGITIKTA